MGGSGSRGAGLTSVPRGRGFVGSGWEIGGLVFLISRATAFAKVMEGRSRLWGPLGGPESRFQGFLSEFRAILDEV